MSQCERAVSQCVRCEVTLALTGSVYRFTFMLSSSDAMVWQAELAGKVHNVDQLWLVLYHQLRLLAVDGRIEVRHSSLRSLFTTLETHSLVLEQASWMPVVHELLLPVLDDVRDCASAASSDEPVEKALGPSGGGGVGTEQGRAGQQMMLIHHSRNTQSKQWDATWETALQVRRETYIQKYIHTNIHTWETALQVRHESPKLPGKRPISPVK